MKKTVFLFLFIVFTFLHVNSQVPEKFNYQGVLRNSSGELVENTSITVKLSLLEGSSAGEVKYSESHTVSTNDYGQFSVQAGAGTVLSGSFTGINWSNEMFLKTEVANPAGGTPVDMGTVQLISVPYALYSNKAKVLDNNALYFTETDTLFAVKDHDGNIVFAVFPDGAKVYVNETVKGNIGGFAVSGRTSNKAGVEVEYLHVTPDSTRIYVNEDSIKGNIGGFAVSGRTSNKGTSELMFVATPDSTRIFTRDTISGFSVQNNKNGTFSSYIQLSPLNYFIGHESGELVQQDLLNPGMGKYNTFFGFQAGKNTVSGYNNIFVGNMAGHSNVSGAWNIFVGNNSGFSSVDALSNIFIGDQAGYNFIDGIQNVFIGNNAGYNSTTNVYGNLFVGNSAGKSNVSGNYNVYVGISAGYSATGTNNTFVGNNSGFSNLGLQNTYIGSESGIYTSTARRNVYIGYRSGYRSTGSGNVFIGNSANNTNFSTVTYSNCVAIGDSVIVNASNQVRLGNNNITSLYCMGAYTSATGDALCITTTGLIGRVTSSKRYKTEITPIEINTSNIYKLRPVSYTGISDNKRHFGLIAEEVAEVIPELASFAREKDVIPGSSSEKLIPDAVQYPILSVLLLNEIQKHETTINQQNIDIEKLKNENAELKNRLEKLEEIILK
ncbi:MAG: hypothetical protein A2X13_07695 [Bacteroidetes bacterium GWC2_33_15]|nr:MAG: hypothetical protein A2X10_01550 [Bacteroidetes bacterium GWA2_33_15]OFX48668.1 MAG: hypothetical protein A2X13_07695 [Bacteroidetes bacterium GWC2_33_15]OFX64642.1 MAG: hypothetical protein A2X15_05285 [Bacteroidetes bacterium GWB2_32_14]OFX67940.1 MAG: hypothetical protein A2X14_01490 [Bacteroidetes bacterium GWD2_33_33]HAN18171.1 hypothetical protein [Bacteroidales bacterium]